MIRLQTIQSELENAKSMGFKTELYSDESRVESRDGDVVVRWGSSRLLYGRNGRKREFKNVLNSSKVIRINCDKLGALKKIAEVVGTPKIFLERVPDGVKVVYRPTEHTGGSGFSVKVGPFEIAPGFYATEFIETEKEFRVWFCGTEMFCCRRVALSPEDSKLQFRSNWGYRYLSAVPPNLGANTLKAVEAIGLDVGAADVLFKGGKYYFMELNSGVSADTGRVTAFYKAGLTRLAAKKFPELKNSLAGSSASE